jgi:8-oxo-dGTP pyrophosphatase MutT (NUDIX family)
VVLVIWLDRVLRLALTGAHMVLKAGSFIGRPRTLGAHALALTPGGRLILVKLRYAPDWRVPGGGRHKGEGAQAAVLRELREEIGMISHGSVRLAYELEQSIDFKRDLAAVLVIEDVRYRPHRWSWEVEQIGEFAIDDLPRDTSQLTLHWVDSLRSRI